VPRIRETAPALCDHGHVAVAVHVHDHLYVNVDVGGDGDVNVAVRGDSLLAPLSALRRS
jgi:hypothetical protein